MLQLTTLRQAVRAGRRHARQYDFTWRYALNLGTTLSYSMNKSAVWGEAASVLANLNRDGIAITSVKALLGDTSSYDNVIRAGERLKSDLAAELLAARTSTDRQVQKPYMYWLLGENAAVEAESVYAKFALEPAITRIVNAYLGLYSNLCFYNIWYNFANKNEASQSQLWHRDPEDRYIVKIFVCMSDVDDGAGPFTYACGTHSKGTVKRTPPYLHTDGGTTRSNDAQMSTVVPPERWVKGVGQTGTLIFADTRGFHKGGLCRLRDRILYTAEYLSPAARAGISTRPAGR